MSDTLGNIDFISYYTTEDHVNKTINKNNKMCYETQMPPYEANSRGGHQCLNPKSRCQN
jgi:hypothetical protein